ncbi:MAG: NAD-dependent epimerase/dehydratase family protein [Ktedonobacterales bacterium]
MRLLILGGTKFLGRHLAAAALAAGHEVTLFNRGQTNPTLYPDAEHLRGDRDGDLAALRGRVWDAAIDTSGYLPRIVRASATLLAGSVATYAFISSKSVYADFSHPGVDETCPVATLPAGASAGEYTQEHYGPLKALCEREVEAALPGRALILRPGLLVGPYDPTDRFTYWPHRIARGGEVLAPAPAERPVQFIDARDLAGWTLRMVERRAAGIFNANGQPDRLSMGELLTGCARKAGADVQLTWVSESFLLDHEVGAWMELPLWIPSTETEMAAFMLGSVARALDAGLSLRPLDETIGDTLAWDTTRPPETALGAGLAPAREAELLAAWHARG